MMHIIPQTRDEKIAMYMKLTKRELVEMLVNSNGVLDKLSQAQKPIWVRTSPQPSDGTRWPIEDSTIVWQSHATNG